MLPAAGWQLDRCGRGHSATQSDSMWGDIYRYNCARFTFGTTALHAQTREPQEISHCGEDCPFAW